MSQATKERITIRLTKRDHDGLQELVTNGFFNSRNEAVRTAIRNLIDHRTIHTVLPDPCPRCRHYGAVVHYQGDTWQVDKIVCYCGLER